MIRDAATLIARLQLPAKAVRLPVAALRHFPVRVPHSYLQRIARGDVADPLLRQVLPSAEEDLPQPGFVADPLAEQAAAGPRGLLHKYHGRVLLLVTGICSIHCRYCFRRHFPYPETAARAHLLQPALDYIRNDASISEVILSGGDPLTLSNRRLRHLWRRLAAIPHVRRRRIHSRVPVVQPERIDDELCRLLAHGALPTVLVIHSNHAGELDAAAVAALARLRRSGLTLLNQAVLLRGVNDTAEAQAALSEALFAAGVLPYYLHLLDPVAGAAHFHVIDRQARRILRRLRTLLPGYLVPHLVREHPGAPYKLPLL